MQLIDLGGAPHWSPTLLVYPLSFFGLFGSGLIHDGGKSLLFWTSTSISALSRFFFAP
jgi:hypothetical protein